MGFSGPIVPNLLRANNASLVEKHCSQAREDCANSDLHSILEWSLLSLVADETKISSSLFTFRKCLAFVMRLPTKIYLNPARQF